jgi:hypothetical protein
MFRAPLNAHIMEILGIHVNLRYNPKHPNNEHTYAKACQPIIALKLTSPCQQAPMVSFSLKLEFQLNPSTP